MNRWTDNYKQHAFHKIWASIRIVLSELEIEDPTVVANVEELARLNKVVEFISNLIDACDPELIPPNVLEQSKGQADQCLQQINTFKANKSIGHLQKANSNLDNVLTYFRPYIVNTRSSAIAAGKAYSAYAKTVEDQIQKLQNKVATAITDIENNKTKSEAVLEKIEETLLLSKSEDVTFEAQVSDLFSELKKKIDKVASFHKKLTSGTEEEAALALQIDEAKDGALKNSGLIDDELVKAKAKLKALNKLYVDMHGTENEEGDFEGGLIKELSEYKKDLEDYENKQRTTHKTLSKEIDGLLPGALSAGLASSYSDLKKEFINPIKYSTWLFYFSVFFLLILAFVFSIEEVNSWNSFKFIAATDPNVLLPNLISKLPFLLPIVWLAIFASKRRSEAQRLYQEYAHKEALAKSYQSFKKQVDELGVADELTKELLKKSIDAVSYNASLTLDGHHGDKMPVQDFIEKVTKNLGPIKIDGLNVKG